MSQIFREPTVEGVFGSLAQRLANLERAESPTRLIAGPSGSLETVSTTPVALTSGPEIVIPTTGTWEIGLNLLMLAQAAGTTGLEGLLCVNGTAMWKTYAVTTANFEGGDEYRSQSMSLKKGDKLTVKVATSNGIKAGFQAAVITATTRGLIIGGGTGPEGKAGPEGKEGKEGKEGAGGTYEGSASILLTGKAFSVKAKGVTEEKLAEALLGPAANVFGLRKLGTGALEAVPGNAVPVEGTTGQVLKKKSNTNYDTEWAAAGGGTTYFAGAGLELKSEAGKETFKIPALAITTEMLEALSVTTAKLASSSVTEAKLAAGSVSNVVVKAAAGIEESKLSLPEVIVKTGTQTISGKKIFNTGSNATAIELATEAATAAHGVDLIKAPLKLTASENQAVVRVVNVTGEIKFPENPVAAAGVQLFRMGASILMTKATEVANASPVITIQAVPVLEGTAESEGSGVKKWHPIAVNSEPTLNPMPAGAVFYEGNVTGLRGGRGLGGGAPAVGGWHVPFNSAVLMEDWLGTISIKAKAKVTEKSTLVTGLASSLTAQLKVGAAITGAGLKANTTIAEILETEIVLSQEVLAGKSGEPTLTFTTLDVNAGLHCLDLKKATENFSVLSEGAAVKLKNEGPAEFGSTVKATGAITTAAGLGVFGHAAPGSQHAKVAAVTNPGAFKKGAQGFETEAEAKAVIEKLEALTTAVTAHTAIFAEYGQAVV